MDLTQLKTAFRRLQTAGEADDWEAGWDEFAAAAAGDDGSPPYHLASILDALDEARAGRPPGDIRLLDHGCGGGLTLLYLLARGYTGVHGVDIGGTVDHWNRLLKSRFGVDEPRFIIYDGQRLPFPDDHFDFIFSEEVIEHVRPAALAAYYAEERRTARPGALVFHRAPHRLTPYESHTQTWLLHYLPRGLWLRALRVLGRDTTTAETALFLRWPWVHRRLVRRALGHCVDRTRRRFVGFTNTADYDGPKRLRAFAGRLATAPVIGRVVTPAVCVLAMTDTVSRIPAAPDSAGDAGS